MRIDELILGWAQEMDKANAHGRLNCTEDGNDGVVKDRRCDVVAVCRALITHHTPQEITRGGNVSSMRCAVCHHVPTGNYPNFCSYCGKALKWVGETCKEQQWNTRSRK